MKNLILPLLATFTIASSFAIIPKSEEAIQTKTTRLDTLAVDAANLSVKADTKTTADLIYSSLKFENESLNKNVFDLAFKGYEKLKKAGELPTDSHLLTVVDFSLSSNKKRMWVIDLEQQKILFHTLVAHGKNTGEEFATNFSNRESSYQSSLGFYVTDFTYNGDNGYSLKLLGKDAGYNDAALKRAIVMHGADYVSDDFATTHKRIGRSWGCPAVPRALAEPIINTIKDKNVLFIYYPNQQYLEQSEWLKA